MRKIFIVLITLLPITIFSQQDTTPTSLHQLVTSIRIYYAGDTVVNLNSLNNGIIKMQISEESKKIIAENGLQLDEKAAVVTLQNSDLLKNDFSFDIKTFATDNEWYENTVKIKVKNSDIRLISVTSDKIEMATGFRKEGKIYVVIAVSMILFFTVVFYLIYLERKTKKLEKQVTNK